MKTQFTSTAVFVEGDLDSVKDAEVQAMLNYAEGIYKAKKTELQSLPQIGNVLAPTAEQLAFEETLDLFDFDTPRQSYDFYEAVKSELDKLGFTLDNGVPGIEIVWHKSQKDSGPPHFVVNSASVTVTFTPEALMEFRAFENRP